MELVRPQRQLPILNAERDAERDEQLLALAQGQRELGPHLREERLHLAVLDVAMPVMSGEQFLIARSGLPVLQDVQRCARSLIDMFDALLDLSRIEAGTYAPAAVPVPRATTPERSSRIGAKAGSR